MPFVFRSIISATCVAVLVTPSLARAACTLLACDLNDDANFEPFLQLNVEADKECYDVLENQSSKGHEADIRREYPKRLNRDTSCDRPFKLLRGAMNTAIYTTKGGKGLFGQEHGIS